MRAYTKGASTPGSSTGPGGPWIRAALSLATRRLGGRVPTRLSHLQLEASPQPDLDSEESVQRAFPLPGSLSAARQDGLGAQPPVSKGLGGWETRHLPLLGTAWQPVGAVCRQAGWAGGAAPSFQRAGGWETRHLPYRDYAGGEDISRSEHLRLTPVCGLIVIGSLCFSLSGQPFRTWPGA